MATDRKRSAPNRTLEDVQSERHAKFDPVQQQEYLRAKEDAELRMSIAELVYEARMRARMSQVQLAALAGTHQSVISSIENGAQIPQIATLFRIAEALNSSLELKIGSSSLVLGAAAS